MFESLVANIKRKLSKTSEENPGHEDIHEKPGLKRSFYLFKAKLLKSETKTLPVNLCDNLALSPRAIGLAECAQTEIEWPILTDTNPNILDKFTRIVTITDDTIYEKKVCITRTL